MSFCSSLPPPKYWFPSAWPLWDNCQNSWFYSSVSFEPDPLIRLEDIAKYLASLRIWINLNTTEFTGVVSWKWPRRKWIENFRDTSCSLSNNMDISTLEVPVLIVIEEHSLGMEEKSILSHFMCLKTISFISSCSVEVSCYEPLGWTIYLQKRYRMSVAINKKCKISFNLFFAF